MEYYAYNATAMLLGEEGEFLVFTQHCYQQTEVAGYFRLEAQESRLKKLESGLIIFSLLPVHHLGLDLAQ